MSRRQYLHVWLYGHHMGVFEGDWRRVRFRYDADAPDTPVSLSLPRDGGWNGDAPRVFPENLLPESGEARYQMMHRLGASSQRPMDLLADTDNMGALRFTRTDASSFRMN